MVKVTKGSALKRAAFAMLFLKAGWLMGEAAAMARVTYVANNS